MAMFDGYQQCLYLAKILQFAILKSYKVDTLLKYQKTEKQSKTLHAV